MDQPRTTLRPDEQVKLCRMVANRMYAAGDDRDELASVAWLGMNRALEEGRFDPAKSQITTYACRAAINEIHRWRLNNARAREKWGRWTVSLQHLAHRSAGSSNEDHNGNRTDRMSILDLLLAAEDPPPTDLAAADFSELPASLDLLDDRSKRVVMMRAGIGCDPMTMPEIGEAVGLCRERVRQILEKAFAKLRKHYGVAHAPAGTKLVPGSRNRT